MSGICGVLVFDGHPPTQGQIDAMIARLERRGPDGSRSWRDGPAALGHSLLATTPEALAEALPLTDLDTACSITADCRIDNREELLAALGLALDARTIGDGELILRAYLRWGSDCPAKLLGDFAFAIWDPRAKKLFCARDHMGMRQLLYHHRPGARFVFATEAGGVLAHPDVSRRINDGRIAEFLDDLEAVDLTSTFYEGVFRLPPAHSLTVGEQGIELRRYWQLEAPPELILDTDDAYAEAFLEVFTEAVRGRLRSAGPVGSMLSGGMDSGSVAAVAARLLAHSGRGPLHSFSAIGPDPDACIETRTILRTVAIPGLKAHFVSHAELGGDQEALMAFPESGEPFDFHMTLVRAVYLAAHRHGMKVVLDGVAGDISLTAGNRAAQLLRRGQLFRAIREGLRESRFWGPRWPSWRTIPQAAWSVLAPAPLRHFRRAMLDWLHDRRISREGLASYEFGSRVDLSGRRRRYRAYSRHDQASETEKRVGSIVHPHLAVARERYDRIASALAIEPRDPFLDVRVIQFCLSLPAAQLQSDGWPKLVLRRAMRGLLPDDVRWRRGKEHLGWAFTLAMFQGWPGWSEQLDRERAALERFVRAEVLQGSNQPTGKALDIEQRFKLFFLLSWLKRSSIDRAGAAPTSGKQHAEENA